MSRKKKNKELENSSSQIPTPEVLENVQWDFQEDAPALIQAEATDTESPEIESLETATEFDEENSFETEASVNDETSVEPQEFVDRDQLHSILESLLFSHDKPVSMATMREVFKNTQIKTKDIQEAIEYLKARYAESERGVMLEEIAGGYQLRTKPDNAKFIMRLSKEKAFRLTGASLEVISIVAYKQPIVKSEIDQIRGVESGHLLRALMDRGLINFQGKSDLPGKPMQYGTTRKFLEIFGLRNLKELPSLSEIDQLIPEGIGDPADEKETLSDVTENMSQSIASTYSEGEAELLDINDKLSQIDTTTDFFEQEKKREKEKRDRERAEDIREAIMLGQEVEKKDIQWLKRYEEKLAMEQMQANAAQAEVSSDTTESQDHAEVVHAQEFTEALEELTENHQNDLSLSESASEDENLSEEIDL